MTTVNMYVDGFNLYHAIAELGSPKLKWVNLLTLAKSFLKDGETIGDVYFFTAVVDWNNGKNVRHNAYVDALEAVGVRVIRGTFKNAPRHCPAKNIVCPDREEKQTDVAIATQMVADALTGKFSRAILVTADTDQIPTIKTIKELCPSVELTLAAPPGRLHMARDLGQRFDPNQRKEISVGHLQTCLLPRVVCDIDGTAVVYRPESYV